MCGIYAYFSKTRKIYNVDKMKGRSNLIKHRGPDLTVHKMVNNNLFFSFHRLKINDLSENGNQPFEIDNIHLICNGEIYNHNDLKNKYKFETIGNSDCEIIIHMYKKFGIDMITQLDGVFAFVLYDANNDILYAGRDPIGVRPMYICRDDFGGIYFTSEMKCISDLNGVKQFPIGSYMKINWSNEGKGETESVVKYHYLDGCYKTTNNETQILKNIKQTFTKAVEKRLMSNRPIGCLLSGGLDSSLVSALVAKMYKEKTGKTIDTYSIGMKGGTDLYYAQKVADYIGSNHHHVEFTEKEGIEAIEEVIKSIESYDITTIRASVGMYLLSKYIKDNTDTTVIYSGEGSDELCQGYIYFHKSPNEDEAHEETVRLMSDLYMYDVLRCDRSTAAHGLEVRVPFLDKEFIELYLSIPNNMKTPRNGCEKYLVRKAFSDDIDDNVDNVDNINNVEEKNNDKLLPDDILWRPKEAFSDGVSSQTKSWFTIIQEFVDGVYSDGEFAEDRNKYKFNTPQIKEAFYYRKIYEKHYGTHNDSVIKYYWMPRWNGDDVVDPSARVLKHYTNDR